jgi:hypothetical protein
MDGWPKPCSIRATSGKLKIACRARAPRRRSPHNSPRPGEPATWRRGAGGRMTGAWRYATCETPRRPWPSSERGANEVYHVRKLADLKQRWQGRREKPRWVQYMLARRRKTLVVCHDCHTAIHAGRPTRTRPTQDPADWTSTTGEPDAVKVARPVVRPGKADVFSRR